MPTPEPRCLICARHDALRGVFVGSEPVLLCPEHHAALGDDAESRFEDEASLRAHPALSRRAQGDPRVPDRRVEERRMFPRPEGRRLGAGRRATDPTG